MPRIFHNGLGRAELGFRTNHKAKREVANPKLNAATTRATSGVAAQ